MTAALADAAADDGRDFPPVIGVDQEGGYVSHLRGIATDFPHFQSAGLAIQADPRLGPPGHPRGGADHRARAARASASPGSSPRSPT